MEVTVGNTAGFCGGVKNAIYKVELELSKKPDNKSLYCIGELVHNEDQMRVLEEKGLTVVRDIEDIPDGEKAIVRAHGISPLVYEYATQHHIEILDLTCPNVLSIHKIAREYAENIGYTFLIADRNHPETIGTIGFAGRNSYIIESIGDIDSALSALKISTLNKLLIISQTTFSSTMFDEIVSELKLKLPANINFEIRKTICDATEIRQSETNVLSKQVDNMIIIGGKRSSNTQKLYEIAHTNCKYSYLVQNSNDLKNIKLKKGKIGVMAGASTPQFVINDVVESLRYKF